MATLVATKDRAQWTVQKAELVTVMMVSPLGEKMDHSPPHSKFEVYINKMLDNKPEY